MIDTLLAHLDRLQPPAFWGALGLRPGEYLVMTLHRPANVDQAATLQRLLAAIAAGARGLPVLFPVHPRTAKVIAETLAKQALSSFRPGSQHPAPPPSFRPGSRNPEQGKQPRSHHRRQSGPHGHPPWPGSRLPGRDDKPPPPKPESPPTKTWHRPGFFMFGPSSSVRAGGRGGSGPNLLWKMHVLADKRHRDLPETDPRGAASVQAHLCVAPGLSGRPRRADLLPVAGDP